MSDHENRPEAPKKLWTPDQKVPESVRKMAFLFFLEVYKAGVQLAIETGHKGNLEVEDAYRQCIAAAKVIHKVDAENDEPKS